MKYLKYIFIIILSFIIGSFNAKAYDCNNYGCATCTYKTNSVTYTITANSGGTDDLAVTIKKSTKAEVGNDTIINQITDKSFISSNKIKCPSSINVDIRDNMANHAYYFNVNGSIKLSKEDNNGKPVKLNYKNAKECKYAAKIIEGSGNAPTVTVKTNGTDIVEYFFSPNAWSIDNKVSNLKASFFKDYMKKDDCPTVYISCYKTSTYSLCNATTNKRLKKDGTAYEEEKAFESAKDKAQSSDENNNKFNTVKPGIKVDIDISGNGCGILGKDLTEWLQWLLDVIRISGLVLSVVLGISDYLRASFSSTEDGMSKANKNFSTRLFCLALLFLVPTLVEFLLTLLNIGATSKDPSCGLK